MNIMNIMNIWETKLLRDNRIQNCSLHNKPTTLYCVVGCGDDFVLIRYADGKESNRHINYWDLTNTNTRWRLWQNKIESYSLNTYNLSQEIMDNIIKMVEITKAPIK